ncbi:MAG: hypothetical protein ACPKPY_06935 [Nitrososphaeraceae archaeon]
MIIPIFVFAGSYLAGEMYKKFVTPQQKKKWENFIKIHHGEVGVIITCTGLLTRSTNLTASGIGLMIHDWKDFKNWFTGDKIR